MRRRALIALVLAAALAAGLSVPALGGPRGTKVRVAACSPGDHSATFKAKMRQIAGGERMAMRITLLATGGDGRDRPLKAPGLGRWHRSKPGVRVFTWKQEVLNLAAGAAYRARVSFRWLDAEGEVLRSERRRSSPCKQYKALPNLRARLIGSEPSDTKGVRRYDISVRNVGKAGAEAVQVQLSVDGAAVDTPLVGTLAAGEERVIQATGPACKRAVAVFADPDRTIVESHEEDNGHRRLCAEVAQYDG